MPRKGNLDKAAVLEAAVDLIESEGVEALSLTRLAGQLGIKTPSLYNHVDGLPGLRRELALLNVRNLRERLGQAAIGKSGAEAVRSIAQAYRAYIKEEPGLYLASLRASGNLRAAVDGTAQSATERALQAGEEQVVAIVLAVVASFGLTGDDAIHAVRGLRSLVHGFATLEIGGGFGMALDCDESFRRLVEVFIRGLQAN
jgi:AcrR family transcriptional regulator